MIAAPCWRRRCRKTKSWSTSCWESAARRLVEDQHARLVRERAGDLDDLALADAQGADEPVGVEVDAHLLEHLHGARPHLAPADEATGLGSRPSEMFSATVSVGASWNSW